MGESEGRREGGEERGRGGEREERESCVCGKVFSLHASCIEWVV